MSRDPINRGKPPGPIACSKVGGVAADLLVRSLVEVGLTLRIGLRAGVVARGALQSVLILRAFSRRYPGRVWGGIVVKIEDGVNGLAGVRAIRPAAAPGVKSG